MTTRLILFVLLLAVLTGCRKEEDDNNNNPNILPETVVLTTEKTWGGVMYFKINAKAEDWADIWVDLNNNAKKDEGEAIPKWDTYVPYKITDSEITKITIHGKITELYVGENGLTAIEANNAYLEYLACYWNKLKTLNTQKLPKLRRIDCSSNLIETLDFSANPNLKRVDCWENIIQGDKMTKLVQSLPKNTEGEIYIIEEPKTSMEKNVCTKAQVKIATDKGWKVYGSFKPYTGS